MKILKLHLRNFKGIRDFELDTQGGNVEVWADNGLGKTSLFDAFTWLLFGKDSLGKTEFGIKTTTPSGEPIHGLDHEVEGVLEVNGQQITLRKVYKEVWTKKRGSATETMTGHTTDHYIDGVPVQAKEYTAAIAEIADESVFRLLTSPLYFLGQMHWQERRKLLLQVCGDMTDAEVIDSSPELAELATILGNRKLEDHKKVIAARRAEINKTLTTLPARIDEATRALPDITGLDAKALQAEIDAKNAEAEQLRQQKTRIESGGEVAEKTMRMREIEAEMLQIKTTHRTKYDDKISEIQKMLSQVQQKRYALAGEIDGYKQAIAANKSTITEFEAQMAELRRQWNVVNETPFHHVEGDHCPTCGQALPADEVQAAHDKALADFNTTKAAKLSEISEKGKKLRAQADALTAAITQADDKMGAAEAQLHEANMAMQSLTKELEDMQKAADAYAESPAYKTKAQEIAEVQASISALQAGGREEIQAIRLQIDAKQIEIRQAEAKLADIERRKQGEVRIDELRAEEKKLAAELEKLERQVYLCEQFTKTKVNALEDKINGRFKLAKFKMFDTQVNGGIADCCEAMYNGVCYNVSLNNAMRINLGLDAINVLSEHYGVSVPVFIDNAESVTDILPTVGQQIKLVVSAADKALRVVCENAVAVNQGRLL